MSKIYTIILISLTLFSSFIHAENEAGTRIAFNEQLISKVIKWGVPQILPKLQDITIPDVSTSVQAGIITIDIRLTEIHVAVNDFKPEDLKSIFKVLIQLPLLFKMLKHRVILWVHFHGPLFMILSMLT